MSGKTCHSPIKKVKRQPTLIISFSQHFSFFEGQPKNSGWNPTGVICYLGSVPGSLWQNSLTKMQFYTSVWQTMTNVESHAHFKSNKAPVYAIKGPETANAKFLKVLISWATKPEDCLCVLTPLTPTNAEVWEIKQVRWCTLNSLEISFKHVTHTLLYVGIRCHTANRSPNSVLA